MGINNGNGIYKGSDCPNDFSGMSGAVNLPLTVDANGNLTNNGDDLDVSGNFAWAEGSNNKAIGASSHAEGYKTKATGARSHAEGESTMASGIRAHAEGYQTNATGSSSHAEGNYTKATAKYSHAEGSASEANGERSHAGGNHCIANAVDAFVHGSELLTTSQKCTVFGEYNADEAAYFIIGGGTADDSRKNIFKIDKSGNLWFMHNGVLTNLSLLLNSHNIT